MRAELQQEIQKLKNLYDKHIDLYAFVTLRCSPFVGCLLTEFMRTENLLEKRQSRWLDACDPIVCSYDGRCVVVRVFAYCWSSFSLVSVAHSAGRSVAVILHQFVRSICERLWLVCLSFRLILFGIAQLQLHIAAGAFCFIQYAELDAYARYHRSVNNKMRRIDTVAVWIIGERFYFCISVSLCGTATQHRALVFGSVWSFRIQRWERLRDAKSNKSARCTKH